MVPRIRRIGIKNYKSLASVSTSLEPLCVLVGRNGTGKSSFVDSLAFVQQCLDDSIEIAFRSRGGIAAVRRKSRGHPTNIGIRLEVDLPEFGQAFYAFEIAAKPGEKFRVAREACTVRKFFGEQYGFRVENGEFTQEIPGIRPKLREDRLALFAVSALEEYQPVFEFLTSVRRYSIHPERLRELQDPDSGDYLLQDGSNAAAVLRRLADDPHGQDTYQRICRLLDKVVVGVRGVEAKAVGQKETLSFRQDIGDEYLWGFDSLNMSDGTLRVLGLLLAVYQRNDTSVVCVEEPEATVHPAVAEALIQVLKDVSHLRQVIVTTHSPDILDFDGLCENEIRVVTMQDGVSTVAELAPATRTAVSQHLYSLGDLLRVDELEADVQGACSESEQLRLFGPLGECVT